MSPWSEVSHMRPTPAYGSVHRVSLWIARLTYAVECNAYSRS